MPEKPVGFRCVILQTAAIPTTVRQFAIVPRQWTVAVRRADCVEESSQPAGEEQPANENARAA